MLIDILIKLITSLVSGVKSLIWRGSDRKLAREIVRALIARATYAAKLAGTPRPKLEVIAEVEKAMFRPPYPAFSEFGYQSGLAWNSHDISGAALRRYFSDAITELKLEAATK